MAYCFGGDEMTLLEQACILSVWSKDHTSPPISKEDFAVDVFHCTGLLTGLALFKRNDG